MSLWLTFASAGAGAAGAGATGADGHPYQGAYADWNAGTCGNMNAGSLDQSPSMMFVPVPPRCPSASYACIMTCIGVTVAAAAWFSSSRAFASAIRALDSPLASVTFVAAAAAAFIWSI